jgi:orotidine-5'-phosphate decarboxylase
MSRIIVALDTGSAEEALGVVDQLGDEADFYKVGLQLYTSAGPDIVRELVGCGKKVFLDLKLHDIPNTVRHAAAAAADLGVDMLTVHATGGSEMIGAAREGLGDGTRLLAVTILTSMSAEELEGLWRRPIESVPEEVLRFAELGRAAGADGVVLAASEAPRAREGLGNDFLLVVPGVRPAGAAVQDQKRVATPAQAVEAGADFLVIGRPVTEAEDPAAAVRSVLAEIGAAGGRPSSSPSPDALRR